MRNFRLAMFTAEPNNIQLLGADDKNAYLQALTKGKLCFVTGQEAEELQDHVLVMYKALNCTRPGRACWHDHAFDIPQPMNFLQPPLVWKEQVSSLPRQGGVTEFSPYNWVYLNP